MYNVLKNIVNYSAILGDLWNYHRDEVNDDVNENNENNNKTTTSRSF